MKRPRRVLEGILLYLQTRDGSQHLRRLQSMFIAAIPGFHFSAFNPKCIEVIGRSAVQSGNRYFAGGDFRLNGVQILTQRRGLNFSSVAGLGPLLEKVAGITLDYRSQRVVVPAGQDQDWGPIWSNRFLAVEVL